MKTAKAHSSSLFLFELIISILFFSVAAAFCVQFIVKAHTISSDTGLLGKASDECASVAEIVSVSDDIEEVCENVVLFRPAASFESISGSEGLIKIFYDKDFESCAEDESVYVLSVKLDLEDNMLRAQMDAGDIYSMSASHYVRKSAE